LIIKHPLASLPNQHSANPLHREGSLTTSESFQIPSSFNRINRLIDPHKVNFGINLAGAFALPLQGFWNAVIHTSATIGIFRDLYRRNTRCKLDRRSCRGTWCDIHRGSNTVPLGDVDYTPSSVTDTASCPTGRLPSESL
jgi:hypothetical protein